jgi:glycerophosphoryl diester phosphodiesterase
MKKIIFLSAVISVLFLSQSAFAQKQCGIVAHRGFWNCEEAGYAKNSIAALRCAQEQGFWGSEFDVNMTSDGVLIVYHDSDVHGKKIEKHPYSDFKDFKIKNGETIPTIDMFLEQGKKYPETMLVYELKPHSCDEVEDRFIELTIEKLKEHELLDPTRVMFISFSVHICEVLAQKLPEFTVQFLGAGKSPDQLADRGINGVDYNHGVFKLHKKWYKKARKRGMSVNAWTVNEEKIMKKMLRMGVDQLTTDNPLKAREVMSNIKIAELK